MAIPGVEIGPFWNVASGLLQKVVSDNRERDAVGYVHRGDYESHFKRIGINVELASNKSN